MADSYLIHDVGSTYSKVAAFKRGAAGLEFLGRAQHRTTLDDIIRGLDEGRAALGLEVRAAISDAVILASSSAAGGLRMVAMGYMPKVTAKAAKEVAMNAGARVLEVVSHDEPAEYRLEILREIRPDIILLAGGTDGGESDSLLENASLIVKAQLKSKVIIAGNISAQPQAAKAFDDAGVSYVRVGNVMPTIHDLNVRPARAAIHAEFIKQITRAPGLARLAEVALGGEVIPTPAAILMGAELLANGTYNQDGVGGLVVLDVGGATTDVHSVLPELGDLRPEERGLVISNDKQVAFRTVEGNLGLRVSASGIVETVGPAGVLTLRDRLLGNDSPRCGCDENEMNRLTKYAAFLEKNTEHLPVDQWELDLEPALAAAALETALRRHAGYWVTEFNPKLGLAPGSPVGRDLRGIKWVVGVGGFFTHNRRELGLQVLREIFKNPGYSLFPEFKVMERLSLDSAEPLELHHGPDGAKPLRGPEFRLDFNYLLYAMGLLGRVCPDQALTFAKKYLEME